MSEELKNEQEALLRLKSALDTIEQDLHWYWQLGDGEGGHVLGLLAEVVRKRGFAWPHDTQPGRAKQKAVISRSLSKQVFERDAYRCCECSSHIDLCCDHVIPESLGGPTELMNLQTLCRPCNSKKAANLPDMG